MSKGWVTWGCDTIQLQSLGCMWTLVMAWMAPQGHLGQWCLNCTESSCEQIRFCMKANSVVKIHTGLFIFIAPYLRVCIFFCTHNNPAAGIFNFWVSSETSVTHNEATPLPFAVLFLFRSPTLDFQIGAEPMRNVPGQIFIMSVFSYWKSNFPHLKACQCVGFSTSVDTHTLMYLLENNSSMK